MKKRQRERERNYWKLIKEKRKQDEQVQRASNHILILKEKMMIPDKEDESKIELQNYLKTNHRTT